MNSLKTYLPYLFGNKKNQHYKLPLSIDWGSLSFEERLMFHALSGSTDHFVSKLNFEKLSISDQFHLFNFIHFVSTNLQDQIKNYWPNEWSLYAKARLPNSVPEDRVQKIIDFNSNQLSVFALMNVERNIPGNIFIKKSNGEFLKDNNKNIWTKKVLGLSSRGLPFCHSNGSTPTGVYKINSVMPEANFEYEFGKNRRLKIHFLSEQELNETFPAEFLTWHWWQEGIVALHLGRSLFRIHGSGRINKNPLSSYFPLVPSSGCLTMSERDFGGLYAIDDQRELLNALLESLGLEKSFTNELKIHGLLYVINFDGSFQGLEFK